MTKIVSPNNSHDQSWDRKSSKSSSVLKTAALLAWLAFASPAFSQDIVNPTVSAKDLDKQYELVLKDLKKKDVDISKAADTYNVKEKDVLETIQLDVNYVIKDLIPKVYVDHLSIKKDLKSWMNKETLLEWIYLNKSTIIWWFSKDLGSKVWDFETNNKYSNIVKYPIGTIDNFADHYAHSSNEKKQLKLIEEVFKVPLDNIDKQFQEWKLTITFPLVAMYNKHFDEWEKIVDSDKRPLTKYIVAQPEKNADGTIDVTFDFNKFIKEEVKAWKSTDKSVCIVRIFQEMMYIAGITAFKQQYELYIDTWSQDIQRN